MSGLVTICYPTLVKQFSDPVKAQWLIFAFQNETQQQQIIKETFQLVSKRDDNVCNFLEGGRYNDNTFVTSSDQTIWFNHHLWWSELVTPLICHLASTKKVNLLGWRILSQEVSFLSGSQGAVAHFLKRAVALWSFRLNAHRLKPC